MGFTTINPASGEMLRRYPFMSADALDAALNSAQDAQRAWAAVPVEERARAVAGLAAHLRARGRKLAEIVTMEMGKPLGEAMMEVDKCATGCEYYGEAGAAYLRDQAVETESHRSYVTFQPLGLVLAIMPWNFPLWQVIRAAVPALIAGNGVLLKHAPSVPCCALELTDLCLAAGLPEGLFTNLFIDLPATADLIRDARVQGVTLTGSTRAGREVARLAGSEIKTCVLELGGSDPYIVLEDADMARTVEACVTGRLINAGQSCIAAKRMIVHEAVADEFTEAVVQRMGAVRVGDPVAERTDVGPLAREDLRDHLAAQVARSMEAGAECALGGKVPDVPGWYYPATVLTGVKPGMPAYDEEMFGPVACIIRTESEEDAIRIANDTAYGLGAAVFTRDLERGERIARTGIEAGSCFVNDFVKSDPRLPFGGVKSSGFGRELADFGIREFVNVKTVRVER
ncbi:MAG: NAD-dependent succinate-semialdehyde dehydrogenase [Gemmatimonadetes bacterium]|nr:NAD-dependent succinate-semialdehyde dehydrogenase [Gemmatimonadota bacterium]MYA40845.1 NAD-dependent succinate-semialdehyde dehydrogenase [Gemmatimonadota bacterium]MYE93527.1 NAD-dependent succinate-semialdehyde dehydrogenase [Gemmatimonadota bacterium]MYJ10361.1 NAD-dependent succinate-semialdehyde dehydrogenase [Gemmatimonadota bacterium]